MPTRTSGRRFARSPLQAQGPSADGAGGAKAVIDFALGELSGIEIIAVTGAMLQENTSYAAADLGDNPDVGVQELHLDPGSLVDTGILQPGDIGLVDIDSDIIYTQHIQKTALGGAATEGIGAAVTLSNPGRVDLTDARGVGVFTARNIQHRAEVESNNSDLACELLIEYYRVQFSLDEIGILNLRRG